LYCDAISEKNDSSTVATVAAFTQMLRMKDAAVPKVIDQEVFYFLTSLARN
jgi:hypothetical protein